MKKFKAFLNKYKLPIIIVILLAIGIGIWIFISNKNKNSSSAQQTITGTVKKGNIVSSISSSGQVQTANYLAVTTSVNGIVKKVFVKEGDKVITGQQLMQITLDSEGTINQASAYSNYLRAKIALESANNNVFSLKSTLLSKQQTLKDAQASMNASDSKMVTYKIASNDYQKAQKDYDMQSENISQLQIALNSAWTEYQGQSSIIVSPATGVIANIVAVEGTQISNAVSSTSRSVITVASIKQVGTPIVSLNVSEVDINNVAVGQKVTLTLNSISNQKFTGSVVGIDKIGTVTSGVSNYPVVVKFDTDSEKVLPNMGVNANIIIAEKDNVLYVPTSAITTVKNKSTVKKINGNTVADVEVTTGVSDGTNTEIVSGLNEDDQVQIDSLPTQGFTNQTSTQNRGASFGVFGAGGR